MNVDIIYSNDISLRQEVIQWQNSTSSAFTAHCWQEKRDIRELPVYPIMRMCLDPFTCRQGHLVGSLFQSPQHLHRKCGRSDVCSGKISSHFQVVDALAAATEILEQILVEDASRQTPPQKITAHKLMEMSTTRDTKKGFLAKVVKGTLAEWRRLLHFVTANGPWLYFGWICYSIT